MSLISFIAEPDVKAKLKDVFPFAQTKIAPHPLLEPRTKHYALIGTAFDYVLRFALQHRYSHAKDSAWVAEIAASVSGKEHAGRIMEEGYEVEAMLIAEIYGVGVAQQVLHAIAEARQHHTRYLHGDTDEMPEELLRSALLLAQIDPFYRASVLPVPFGEIDSEDIEDLMCLFHVIPWHVFTSQSVCLLDPTFGASGLVGGADVDLVLDNMLIDIKTTKFLQIKRDYINQLLGYYILSRIGGINGVPKQHKINTIGIYFSRHGYLHTWSVHEFIQEDTFPAIQQWFEQRANERYTG